jgi:lauroyl/myristoyl acyltransferase
MPLAERLLMEGLLLPGYRYAPSLMRRLRPTLVRSIWALAPDIRHALRNNARVLKGKTISRREARNFGLDVLAEIQRFTDELVQCADRCAQPPPAHVADGEIERFYERRKQGGGVLFATAHMGSFEAAASMIGSFEPRVHVLYARDASASVERMRSRLRKRLGVIEHAVDDGLATWNALRNALENNEAVAIPADRTQPGQPGFDFPLLGQTTKLPAGPFKLAMAAKCPLVPVFCWHDDIDGYRIAVNAPIECDGEYMRNVSEHPAVAHFVQAFERQLRAHPEQWLMVFDAWPSDEAHDA